MFGTYKLRKSIQRYFLSKSGWVARRLRFPVSFNEPWRRPVLDVSRESGIGDVLLCTSVLREVKRRNPMAYIRFYTHLPGLVRGLPYIDEVHPMDMAPPTTINLRYENIIPTNIHLAKIFGDCLGVQVHNIMPDCMVRDDLVGSFRVHWGKGPNIVVLMKASQYTPNKDWPMDYWNDLIKRISKKYHIILIGDDNHFGNEKIESSEMCTDMRGLTNLEELLAIVAAGDLYVGPVSGPSHIAAAVGCPSVVICGGYESHQNACYPNSIILYDAPQCSPCWLRTPCPYSKKCLTSITIDLVEKAIMQALNPINNNERFMTRKVLPMQDK